MAKVDTTGDCWFWTGSTSPAGYGRVRFRGAFWQAHRAVYTLLRGEIADGMELDHLCFVTGCVNPDHLEPVTPAVNRARVRPHTRPWMSDLPQNTPREVCKRGHALTPENTKQSGSRRGRSCKECDLITQRERRAARRA